MTEEEKQWLLSGSSMPFAMWKATQGYYGGIAITEHHMRMSPAIAWKRLGADHGGCGVSTQERGENDG